MKKKEEEQELSFGQRFDKLESNKEVTMKDFESPKPAPKTRRERFDDKFVRGERGKLLRRGTAASQRAAREAEAKAKVAAAKKKAPKTKAKKEEK